MQGNKFIHAVDADKKGTLLYIISTTHVTVISGNIPVYKP